MPSGMMVNAWLESGEDVTSWGSAESPYHAGLRAALAPEYRGLPAEEIDTLVEQTLESVPAEQAEDFGRFLSDVGRTVAPIAAQVLPVAAPIVGTMIGGPVGTMVGGAVGRYAGQALAGAAPAPAAPRVAAPRPAPRPVAQPVPPPRPAPAPPVAEPAEPAASAAAPAPPSADTTAALGQLIALLDSPALRQLITGQLLGSAGARTVPVGPEQIPVSFPTMMEALSVVAGAAAEATAQYGEGDDDESTAFLRDASGRFVYDPAAPDERAAALVAHLRAGEAAGGWTDEPARESESVDDWLVRARIIQ